MLFIVIRSLLYSIVFGWYLDDLDPLSWVLMETGRCATPLVDALLLGFSSELISMSMSHGAGLLWAQGGNGEP